MVVQLAAVGVHRLGESREPGRVTVVVGPDLIGVLPPASYVSYNILALLCCASLIPLTVTRLSQPKTPDAPRLR